MKFLQILWRMFLLASCFISLTACTRPQPSREEIKPALQASLPSYLNLTDLQIVTEEIFDQEFQSKITAKVVAQVNLYTPDTETSASVVSQVVRQFVTSSEELEFAEKWLGQLSGKTITGSPLENTLLRSLKDLSFVRLVSHQGESTTVYATVSSEGRDNQFVMRDVAWDPAEILTQARPLSDFPAGAIIVAPDTVRSTVDEIVRKVSAALAADQAREEKRKKSIQAAFAAGKRYVGRWTDPHNGNSDELALVITHSDGRTFSGTFCHPSKPGETRPVTGIILTDQADHQATLTGVPGEGLPARDEQIEGLHAFHANKITRARTYYRLLESSALVDFKLQIQEGGRLLGHGMMTSSYGRKGKTKGELVLQEKPARP